MKTQMMHIIGMMWLMLTIGCGNDAPGNKEPEGRMDGVPAQLQVPAVGTSESFVLTSTAKWSVTSDQSWCTCTPQSGYVGETNVKITALKNATDKARTAILAFVAGTGTKTCTVSQEAGTEENYVPAGYTLVWQDEFNDPRLSGGKPAMPNTTEWWYETGASGWGNNEIQNYIAGAYNADTCAVVTGGSLKIIAKKRGTEVISVRMNTSKSWTYGYFEARLKLPQGKGTWPAFWMMPKNFKEWPADGEIDIMEEVGYRPNWTSSAIHCTSYNHSIGTQKTGEQFIATAESDFHVYALEWTEESIKCFVDGKIHFTFTNDKKGDKNTWPFNAPFYLKLNLAWGGNWGGAQGVDESKLPATYEIDYVRVYQKK